VAILETTEIVPIETPTSFLQWTPVIAGALVASALSLVLIAFGSAIGLSIVSSSPTWRDASPALALLSGLYLLLTALAAFGLGGYVAGRLRERWLPGAHTDVVEFRDGTHGVVAWALAVVFIGLVVAASAAAIASKAAMPSASPAATAGEPLIAYELDRLFRGDRRPIEADITYSRAEAGRILLAATGRQGITSDDRAYLVRLIEARTGIAQPEAERRVDDAGNNGCAEGAPKRRDPRFCHRCIFTGRGRCDLVRSLRWRTASGRCPSGSYVALAATRLGAQTNRAERIGELARCYQFRWKPALA
jgi:hypothetical protein